MCLITSYTHDTAVAATIVATVPPAANQKMSPPTGLCEKNGEFKIKYSLQVTMVLTIKYHNDKDNFLLFLSAAAGAAAVIIIKKRRLRLP
jgi:hypothetical protein